MKRIHARARHTLVRTKVSLEFSSRLSLSFSLSDARGRQLPKPDRSIPRPSVRTSQSSCDSFYDIV